MKLAHYYLALVLLLLVACEKNIDVLPPTPDTNDQYVGIYNEICLDQQTADFRSAEAVMRIKTSSGDVIERDVTHHRQDGESLFSLTTGLKPGSYRLLELIYKEKSIDSKSTTDQSETKVYGLGCSIDIAESGVKVTSPFSTVYGFSGSGTAEDPYVISSEDHLEKLRSITDSEGTNRLLTSSTCFRQCVDIKAYKISNDCSGNQGWLPIGNEMTTAFPSIYNGAGYKIEGLKIDRQDKAAVGLFGYIAGATIDSVVMVGANVKGVYGTAALVGAVTTAGDKRQISHILNSRVESSSITGVTGGLATGALVGIVDQNVPLSVIRCSVDSETNVNGSYGVGGLVGISSIFSLTLITDCYNDAPITAEYSGAGGIVGSADTLYITRCSNSADIIGGQNYKSGDLENAAIGSGGIAGGSGISFLTSCRNTGDVSGYEGVGGLIGSTRVKGSEQDASVYNNTLLQGCSNTGSKVSGHQFVGGLCGEAQFGCFGVYNTASVKSAESYAGGIVGTSSISVVQNALNMGSVDAKSHSGGIVGKTTFGSIALNRNFGAVTGDGEYVAGIVGLSGNNTMIHYCSNYGYIKNSKDGTTAGIVGKVGDPRKWSGWDIAECVIGGAELVLSVAGPVIAYTAEAAEAAGEVVGATETILEIAEIGEKVTDVVILIADVAALSSSLIEYYSSEELNELLLTVKSQAKMDMSAIANEMEQLQSSAIAGMSVSSSFDDLVMGKTILDNTTSIARLCEEDEEIGDEFQLAINEKREERYEEVESAKKSEELVHNILTGICISVSASALIAGFVASAVVSGGTMTAAIVTATITGTAAISAATGGANSISKAVDNFTNNAVVISQCVNMGAVEVAGSSSAHSGGIVGHLQEFCQVKDCLNVGEMINKNQAGAICGVADSSTDFERCLNVGKGWVYPSYSLAFTEMYIDNNDIYYVEPSYLDPGYVQYTMGTKLTVEQAGKATSYKKWSIAEGENSLWMIPQSNKASYPVPYQTEMLIKE